MIPNWNLQDKYPPSTWPFNPFDPSIHGLLHLAPVAATDGIFHAGFGGQVLQHQATGEASGTEEDHIIYGHGVDGEMFGELVLEVGMVS